MMNVVLDTPVPMWRGQGQLLPLLILRLSNKLYVIHYTIINVLIAVYQNSRNFHVLFFFHFILILVNNVTRYEGGTFVAAILPRCWQDRRPVYDNHRRVGVWRSCRTV